jgi:hypothetical protein
MAEDEQDSRWLSYLYRQHSQAELEEWTRELRYFRYCRALGGHANDGDALVCALNCPDEATQARLLAALGAKAAGRATLAGASAYLSVHGSQLELTLSGAAGDPYEVTRADVDQALSVEALLEPLAADVIVPPRAEKHCFTLPLSDGGRASAAGTRTD